MILEGRSKYVTDFYDLFACAHIDGREGEAASGRNRFHSSHRISTPSLVDPAIRKEANHHPRIGHSNFHKTCVRSHFPSGISLSLSRPLTSTRFKKVYPSVIERGGGGLTSKEGFIESISVSPEQSSVKSYALIPSTFPANM